MAIETVAVISPGDMGHVVGKVIRDRGFRVITSLSNRSALSCSRAARSGMEDVENLRAVMQEADVVLSIMPPECALSFAEAAAELSPSQDAFALRDRNTCGSGGECYLSERRTPSSERRKSSSNGRMGSSGIP